MKWKIVMTDISFPLTVSLTITDYFKKQCFYFNMYKCITTVTIVNVILVYVSESVWNIAYSIEHIWH